MKPYEQQEFLQLSLDRTTTYFVDRHVASASPISNSFGLETAAGKRQRLEASMVAPPKTDG